MTQFMRRIAALPAALAGAAALLSAPAGAQQSTSAATPNPPAPASSPTYLPRYQFKVGPGLPYEMTVNVNGSTQSGSVTVPTNLHQEFYLMQGYKNVSEDGGQADLALQFKMITITVNGRFRALAPDELADLQAASPQIRMRSDGTVASVTAAGGATASALQGMQGAILPQTALPIGGVWHSVFVLQGQKFDGRYTLASVAPDAKGDQLLTVNITLTARSEPGGRLLPNIGRMYIAANGTGQLHFDNTLGMLRDSNVTMLAKVNTQPRQPGQKQVHSMLTTKISWQYAPDVHLVMQADPPPVAPPAPAAPAPVAPPIPLRPPAAAPA